MGPIGLRNVSQDRHFAAHTISDVRTVSIYLLYLSEKGNELLYIDGSEHVRTRSTKFSRRPLLHHPGFRRVKHSRHGTVVLHCELVNRGSELGILLVLAFDTQNMT